MYRFLLPLFVFACTPTNDGEVAATDTDANVDTDVQDDVPLPCEASLETVLPENLEKYTDRDLEVMVTYTDAVPKKGAWSLEIEGVSGTAALDDDGMRATFVADDPLAFDTVYTIKASVCDNPVQDSFFWTIPEPVDETKIEHAYEMLYDDLVWVDPGVSVALHPFVQFESFLMQVVETHPGLNAFDATFTAGWDTGNIECGSVVDLTADYSENPLFNTGGASLLIPVTTSVPPTTITVEDFRIEGTFRDEGDRLTDIVMRGQIDMRGFDALLGGVDACILALTFGDTCGPCQDQTNNCIPVHIESEQALIDDAFDIPAQLAAGECE
jgi:hypothetical protein